MGAAQDYSPTHPHKNQSWKTSQGTSGQRPCQKPLVDISVPFLRLSIWGLSNSQQCLGSLQYPVNHQHNQIQRLSRTELKGSLLSWQFHVPKDKGDSVPWPRLHSGAVIRFCTFPCRERQVIQSPRPVRGPGKEAQKARRDGGKTHPEGPKKPGHAITASRS